VPGSIWIFAPVPLRHSNGAGLSCQQDRRNAQPGIEVAVGRLLYVCDYLPGGIHVVHVSFEAERTGGTLGDVTEGADTRPIRSVEFVKLADLPSLGFTEKFRQLTMTGFPGAGSYMGAKSNIGL
jgi:hypothetical protein